MKKIILNIFVNEYDSISELNAQDRNLLKSAQEAVDSSYSPYSNFKVGAAVLLDNGVVVKGSNQENVAYPSGLCAERVAMFAASAQHPNIPIKSIAITAKSKNFKIDTPITPCGACRQVMAEYETHYKNRIRVIMMGETGKIYIIDGIENILPLNFQAKGLKKE